MASLFGMGRDPRSAVIGHMDHVLIALGDGKPIPEDELAALPPWRQVLLARLAVKIGGMDQARVDELTNAAGGLNREPGVPRSDVEYAVYRARDLLERGQAHDAWSLLDRMTRRIGTSESGPCIADE